MNTITHTITCTAVVIRYTFDMQTDLRYRGFKVNGLGFDHREGGRYYVDALKSTMHGCGNNYPVACKRARNR